MTGGPDPAPDEARFPVFVDDTGRRHRWLRWTGWLVGALAAAYLALFAVSIASSPGLLPLSIPGVGRLLPNPSAPDIPVAGGGKRHPSQVVSTPSPSAPGVVPVTTPTPSLTPTPRRSGRPTTQPTPTRTVGRTNPPSATPTAKPTRTGSPTAHPTPRRTGSPTAHPTHSPRR